MALQASRVETASDGVVTISYTTLLENPESLEASISRAFGSDSDCLGLIVVKDLPSQYSSLRLSLLLMAERFAALHEATREQFSDPATRFSFGWSHGKEIMNGKPDILKGSYYANIKGPGAPSHVTMEQRMRFPEYYGENIWPDEAIFGLEGFRSAFEQLGQFVLSIGCSLAKACQPFVAPQLLDKSTSLHDLICYSLTTKARLLHYFPASKDQESGDSGQPGVNACGYHMDHSMLTGLCSALYLTRGDGPVPSQVTSPSPVSGLYIRTRGDQVVKASFPADCLAFQTGEALEIATGGRLRATPHYVRVEGGHASDCPVSRETFALFMQPDTEQIIGNGETFGQFSRRIFAEHYDDNTTVA